jgi:RNA polymerase sigma-70 factor (ECF subfamily)
MARRIVSDNGGVTAELAATFRAEWSRVLANLVRFTGDIDLAEECTQEAFLRAVEHSEKVAHMQNPGGWLTTVAKNAALDRLRRQAALARKLPRVAADLWVRFDPDFDSEAIDDDRLRLVFTACHPDLSDESRLALALRFVCGIPTAEIAALFFVSEPTMAARLTRAKKRIAAAGSRFALPELDRLGERIDTVRTTVYLLYTTVHAAPGSAGGPESDTSADLAISMARHLCALYPDDRENAGLLALLLLTQARSPGRITAAGDVLSLEEVNRSTWDRRLIDEGLAIATRSLPGGGRFALQAGISGMHSAAETWAETPWAPIVSLYDRLIEVWPSPSVRLSAIIARSYVDSPAEALVALDALEDGAGIARQLAATRGDLLRRLDRHREAIAAYELAVRLEPDPAVRGFLLRRVRESEDRASPEMFRENPWPTAPDDVQE